LADKLQVPIVFINIIRDACSLFGAQDTTQEDIRDWLDGCSFADSFFQNYLVALKQQPKFQKYFEFDDGMNRTEKFDPDFFQRAMSATVRFISFI
jgi:hypothetical protein